MTVVGVEKDFENLRLILFADFSAPIERVWELWADPRLLERWWGPPTHPSTVEKHDLTVGGEVTYFMTGQSGERSRGRWKVEAVSPPNSLEFTDAFADHEGTPSRASPTTRVRVRLMERDTGTRMELQFLFESPEHWKLLERWSAFEVFPQSVNQMDVLLAGGAEAETKEPRRL
jgi:uncharacterized protein YndB with AHSA1/START domain